MQIELAPEQAQNLLQLLDIAVKAGGLNAAKPAYDIAEKVQLAFNDLNPETTND